MPTFKVFGKVEPASVDISFDFEPQIGYRIAEADLDLKCSVAIRQSNVTVTCDTNRWDDQVMGVVVRYLADWIGAEIDLFTFLSGNVAQVRLDRAELPDGSSGAFVGAAPDLSALATVGKRVDQDKMVHVEMRELVPVVVGDPRVMLALSDLSAALSHATNSVDYCARAVAALRQSLAGKDVPADRAADHFHAVLRLSQPFLQPVLDGAPAAATARQEVLRRAWIVMNRFLHYRLGKDQPLPENDYPVL